MLHSLPAVLSGPVCRYLFAHILVALPGVIHTVAQVANLAEKDKQLGEVAERVSREIEASEPRSAPPGFEQVALAKAEVQAQPDTGIQLAEEALAAPGQQPRATSESLAAAVNPKSPRQANSSLGTCCIALFTNGTLYSIQSGTIIWGDLEGISVQQQVGKLSLCISGLLRKMCDKTLLLNKTCNTSSAADGILAPSEPGKADGLAAMTDTSPFGVPSIQGTKGPTTAKLPTTPQVPSSAEAQPARSNASQTQSAMDHKRAFQAVNAETLELALQDIDYEMPPHKVFPLAN